MAVEDQDLRDIKDKIMEWAISLSDLRVILASVVDIKVNLVNIKLVQSRQKDADSSN